MKPSLRFLLYLSWSDFSAPYRGSYLGFVWGFIEPLFYISLTFFFFQYVMGGTLIRGAFYANYVLPPLLGWMVASVGTQAAVSAVAQFRQFLQEDIDLRLAAFIKLLPIFVIHTIMVTTLSLFFYFNGMSETFSLFYLIYAMTCLATVLVGLFWILMSLAPFVKDVRNIIGIVLTVGFWISPIFWDASRFPSPVSHIIQFSPYYYPLLMYRAAFTGGSDQLLTMHTVLFWLGCFLLLYFGTRIYKRARLQFGDVV